jgi:ADP-heptose:LPS heptosyltransferase
LSVPVSYGQAMHEVERVFALAGHLGIGEPIPALKIVPDPEAVRRAHDAFAGRPGLKVGIQISTRRPEQRWPAERFAELIRRLHQLGAVPMLLWSPGPADHPRHPGDDEKAMEISQRIGGDVPLVAYRAGPLGELIGALAACDAVVTSDGGAMHLAAALGKPIVCFFGDMPPERWRPWGVPHRVLRPESRKVADLTVEEVVGAYSELMSCARAP